VWNGREKETRYELLVLELGEEGIEFGVVGFQ